MDCMNFNPLQEVGSSIITVCKCSQQLCLPTARQELRLQSVAAIRVRESGQIPAISEAFWRMQVAENYWLLSFFIITVKNELNTVSVSD